jgi:phosphoribosylglycinamide formyltransferase 1
MPKVIKVAAMCSTNGTDLQTIVPFLQSGKISAKIELIFANTDCPAIEKAKKYGVKHIVVESKGRESVDFHNEVIKIMHLYQIDLIILVGYMKILPESFVKEFKNKIINVHPSLLPKYPGMDSLNDVLKAEETETGCTLHFVDEGVDSGPIIIQGRVQIEQGETHDSLKTKVQAKEMELYPKVIQWFVEDKIEINGKEVKIRE